MARRVTFNETDAGRISRTVRAYERGNRDQSPVMFRQVGDDNSVRLCKTSAQWTKGTLATLNVWESGTPPNETQSTGVTLPNCVNKFATVASGKWVMVAQAGNGSYYLIAAEC
jgi:hypothetical protein